MKPWKHDLVHNPHLSYFAWRDTAILKRADHESRIDAVRSAMAELTEAELAQLRQTFDSCDLNGDGFISPEEFHVLLIKLDGDVSQEECLLDFDVADTEGDGYIGFKEFVVWWTS